MTDPVPPSEFPDPPPRKPMEGALRAAFGATTPEAEASAPASVPGAERYRFQEEIGRGGVGVVHRGRDQNLDRDVALKVLGEAHATNPELVTRFQAEARIGGQLQHPGVVPVYELGTDRDRGPFFAMKLVEGRTLQELLSETAPETRSRHLRLFAQVCEAVAFAHARGIVHRDLKPANVMVGEFGEVQVVDWGLARTLGEGGEEQGSVYGTPSYMAPEQARGEVDRVDRRSDVFALGATLCEILTGEPPYRGSRAEVLEAAHAADLQSALDRLRSSPVDAELKDLVRACLSEDPDARPTDAAQVAAAVEAHLDGLEERRRQADLGAAEARGRAVQERRLRQRTMTLAAAILVAVVGIGSVLAWRQWERGQQADAIATEVGQVLGRVRVLQLEAPDHEAPLSLWEEAAAGAEQAWTLIQSGPARTALREEVQGVRDVVARELEAAQAEEVRAARDLALLDRCNGLVARWGVDSWEVSNEGFREAYLDYGLDVDAMDREDLLAVFAGRPLAVEIGLGLFAWVRVRAILEQGPQMVQSAWFQKVFWVIQQADPDPQMHEIRRFTLDGNVQTLVALADGPDARTMGPRPVLYLGVLLHDMGEPARAVQHLKDHLPRFPQEGALYLMLGEFLVGQDRMEEAVRILHASLAMDPELVRAWTLLAEAYSALSDWQYSVQYARGALQREPDHVPTLLVLVRGLHRLGHTEEARAEWDRLWALAPEHGAVRLHQAWRYGWEGRSEDAVRALLSLTLTPGMDPELLVRAGEMLADHGRNREALQVFGSLRQAGFVTRREGRVLLQQGRAEDAIALFRARVRQVEDPATLIWLDEAKEWFLAEDDLPEEVDDTRPPGELARYARIWESRAEPVRAARFWEAALEAEVGDLPGLSARLSAARCALQAADADADHADHWRRMAESWLEEELDRRVSRPRLRMDWQRREPLTRWLRDPRVGEHLDGAILERLRQAALFEAE